MNGDSRPYETDGFSHELRYAIGIIMEGIFLWQIREIIMRY